MAAIPGWRKRGAQAMMSVFAVAALLYLVTYSLNPDTGIVALQQSSREVALLKARVAEARETRQVLERRVALLRGDARKGVAPDGDIVEERARAELFYARPDEIVIDLRD